FLTFAGSFSKPNSGAWTPITTRPASLYFAAHAFIYGSSRRLLIHEYVQKLTSTTFPCSALLFNGAELIQASAPSKPGDGPSSPLADAIATIPPTTAIAINRQSDHALLMTTSPNLFCRGPREVISGGAQSASHIVGVPLRPLLIALAESLFVSSVRAFG